MAQAVPYAVRIATGLLLGLALLLAAAHAQEKPLRGVALVVGQSRYEHLPPLANPANDARDMARLLDDLGFDVDTVEDGDRADLDKALRRFVEDAADADVALLYYSGHGIEAGGENFLLPVETLPAAGGMDAAALVSVGSVLSRLQATVPVTIVLLDACRDNPFPPGTTIAGEAPSPIPVGASGLAVQKGAAPLSKQAADTIGTVIGFAAEPGRAALDGRPGTHSPYAAALLKHLPAAGFDFGDVMTMVTEEVYLATGTKQLPWTNASLRRLLYFGRDPEQREGDEAAIRGERRKLLLTIASTPEQTRGMVEQVAAVNNVPLDALYGMLSVLQVDTSGGPQDLQAQLLAGAQRLQSILAERDTQTRQDPDLIRLAGLADKAEQEGAIALALQFRDRASARAREIDKAIDEAEANIQARRLELANTFADNARTALLNFEFRTAAERFADAYDQARRWDPPNAFLYKVAQADALTDQGMVKGENAALTEALNVYADAAELPGAKQFVGGAAGVMVNAGITLNALAERENGTQWAQRAVEVFNDALKSFDPRKMPDQWATVQLNLGNSWDTIGQRNGGAPAFRKALEAYRGAQKVYTRRREPDAWAGLQNNIGNSLMALGIAESNAKRFAEAVASFEGALEVWTRDRFPQQWAMAQGNMGSALNKLGESEKGTKSLEASLAAYMAKFEVVAHDRQPMDWASTQNNLGGIYQALGVRKDSVDYLEKSLEAFRNAHLEITRERDPLTWAAINYNMARSYSLLGERQDGTESFDRGIAAIALAFEEIRRDTSPLPWGRANSVQGDLLYGIAGRTGDRAKLAEARQAYVDAQTVFDEQGYTVGRNYLKRQIAEIDATLGKTR